jgi:hypothetical protein
MAPTQPTAAEAMIAAGTYPWTGSAVVLADKRMRADVMAAHHPIGVKPIRPAAFTKVDG